MSYSTNGSLIVIVASPGGPPRSWEASAGRAFPTKGHPGYPDVDAREVHEMEPNLSEEEVVAAIYCPTGGIVCPVGSEHYTRRKMLHKRRRIRFNTRSEQTASAAGRRLSLHQPRLHLTRCVVSLCQCVPNVSQHGQQQEDPRSITPRRGGYCHIDKGSRRCNGSDHLQPGKYGEAFL